MAIHLYCPYSLYFVFKMHSKSDNLGYLKDQKRQIFWGLCRSECPYPPKPPHSKVLASHTDTSLFFSGLTLRLWWHVCYKANYSVLVKCFVIDRDAGNCESLVIYFKDLF